MPEVAVVSLRVVHRTAARIFTTSLAAVVSTLALMTVVPVAAHADTVSMESQFIAKLNAAREANGQRPYSVASDLTSVARSHSRAMASSGQLYHNPNLTTDIQNWQAVGENVGEGPTVSDIHTAFMNSPEHRDNILDHDFTQVGVGVSVDGNGMVWVTEDFREPMGSSSTSTSTSTHHPTSHVTSTRPRQVASAPRPAASTPRPVVKKPAPRAPQVHRPAAAPTPQATLLARLTALQTAAAKATTADPVAAAFDYLDNVTTLTSNP